MESILVHPGDQTEFNLVKDILKKLKINFETNTEKVKISEEEKEAILEALDDVKKGHTYSHSEAHKKIAERWK